MNVSIAFRPKLVEVLKGYTAKNFFTDLVAGITVGIVALPLAMAFAIASGVKPEAGIFTAVIAGFIISAFGGSRVSIGGPTGAFVVIVYGILQQYGAANLTICTIMAGFILLIMGFARMGTMIKYIPYPVTVGFTSGIAVLIFSTQIKDFFGLQLEKPMPADFLDKITVFATHLDAIAYPTLGLAVASFLIIMYWPKRLARWVPGSIAALVLATSLVWLVQSGLVHLPFQFKVDTIGSRFGGIPQSLPPHFPAFDWHNLRNLVRPATTIALLAAIESLLCCVVADGMIDDRHDSNQELMAQGLANIVSPLFGGIAATGAIARTATNVKNGGRSPIAGIVHAITLLLVILVAAPLAKFIPLATLSAVLIVVAYNMGEWHQFVRLRRWPKSDAAVFLTAFALTVLIDLTAAVEVGMVLAAILFIKRISETSNHPRGSGQRNRRLPALARRQENPRRRHGLSRLRRLLLRRGRQVGDRPQARPPGPGHLHPAHAQSPGHGRHRSQRPRRPLRETPQARQGPDPERPPYPTPLHDGQSRLFGPDRPRKRLRQHRRRPGDAPRKSWLSKKRENLRPSWPRLLTESPRRKSSAVKPECQIFSTISERTDIMPA